MKNKKTKNPFANLILDAEEKMIEEMIERGEFKEISNIDDTKKMLKEAALLYSQLHTSKPITLRVKQLDLIKIKAKAKKKNIPYQTLLGALLHEFAEGETELSI